MALICSFNCADTIFDIYDSDRVPVGVSSNKYYVTPSLMEEIETWMRLKSVDKIFKKEQVDELIALGLLGEYHA